MTVFPVVGGESKSHWTSRLRASWEEKIFLEFSKVCQLGVYLQTSLGLLQFLFIYTEKFSAY
jgi:hypothetical protein